MTPGSETPRNMVKITLCSDTMTVWLILPGQALRT